MFLIFSGKANTDVYKESSRKRKAINPSLRNRYSVIQSSLNPPSAKATKIDQRNYQLVLSVPTSPGSEEQNLSPSGRSE